MDDAIRAKERRFRETGDVADEVAWLRERLRAGEISRERVDLARYCGNDAAALVLGITCENEPICFKCSQLESVLDGLTRWGGAEARIRAAITAASLVLETWVKVYGEGGTEALSKILWYSWQPREGRILSLGWGDLRAAMEEGLERAWQAVLANPAPRETLLNLRATLQALMDAHPGFNLRPVTLAVDALLARPALDWHSVMYVRNTETLFAAIGREVSTWALGYGDPVRDRVAMREKSREV